MFTLKDRVAADSATDLDDSATIKFALTALGDYDDNETGLSPYTDNQLFKSIRSFQEKNDLKVDGVINRDGPTQAKMNEKLAQDEKTATTFGIFTKNYLDMRKADTKDSDKYFHCKANYEAAQRGWKGAASADFLSDTKEALWFPKEAIKDGFWNALEDSRQDQIANKYGRDAAASGKYSSAEEACAIYRPNGLNEKY